MSFEFVRFRNGKKFGRISMDGYDWRDLFTIARMNGWKPAGPLPPRDYVNADEYTERCQEIPRLGGEVWGYSTNDCQEVTDVDARNLADALERALPDIPRHNAMTREKFKMWAASPVLGPISESTTIFERLSGEPKRREIELFIAFCRDGGFEIR